MKAGTYRPTTLKMASKHCPRAITHYENGVAQDRAIFVPGTAAHAILQACTEMVLQTGEPLTADDFETLSRVVCEEMIATGRWFESTHEPALAADAVWAGRDIVRDYLDRRPIEFDESIEWVRAETGLAVNADFEPIEYSPDARLRLIADVVWLSVEIDEENMARVLTVHDYKSAWPTSASELDTVQLKAQACLAWEHLYSEGDEADIVRQSVTNLRTSATFTRDLWMAGDGAETMDRWKKDVMSTMDALDRGRDSDGVYAASPGRGCMGCPYLHSCDAGQEFAESIKQDAPLEDRAKAWLTLKARAKELENWLRAALEDGTLVRVGDAVVGTVAVESRSVADGSFEKAWAEWSERGGDVETFLMKMGGGVRQLENVAKAMFPERDMKQERDAFVEALLGDPSVRRKFGDHPMPADELLGEKLGQSVEG